MSEYSPVRYDKTAHTFEEVYNSIEADIRALRNNTMKLEVARTVLAARRTQLRTAELALAMQRLYLTYEREADRSRKLRKAS